MVSRWFRDDFVLSRSSGSLHTSMLVIIKFMTGLAWLPFHFISALPSVRSYVAYETLSTVPWDEARWRCPNLSLSVKILVSGQSGILLSLLSSMKSFAPFEILSIVALREALWGCYNISLLMMDLGFPILGFLLSLLSLIGCFIVFRR
jgi:hypothetical protein